MKVRIVHNDDCGSCVTYNDVYAINEYDDEIVIFFELKSKYAHCVLDRDTIKHLKVLYDK